MILLIIIILISTGLFYASYSIEANIYIKSFCRNQRAGRAVAITFDDGVEPGQTEKVLDVLKKHDVKGLFFIVGNKAEKYPELVRRIVKEKHLIGNHSYSHSWSFPLKSTKNITKELERTNTILSNICGIKKIEYFRPPFGVTNPNVAKAIKALNMTSIGWNIRSYDTKIKTSRDNIAERVLSKIKDGSVILLHDRLAESDTLLEQIICGIKEMNYRIEPLNILKDN